MIGDLIGDLLGQALFEAVFYIVGRIAIPVVSFGGWHCLPLMSHARGTSWGGFIQRTKTRIYFTSGGTVAVGGLVCLLVAVAAVSYWYLRNR